MFEDIAGRVGKNLNNTNWTTAVNDFGTVKVMNTDFASLHAGKYDADDTYGLVAFDPKIPPNGEWKALTPVRDAAASTESPLTRGNARLEGTRQTDTSVIEFGPASHSGGTMGRTKAAHRPLPRAGYAVIVVAALLFAACGGDDDDSGGAKDTTPTSAASGSSRISGTA